ncbi:MAG: MFS transporter [Candidatus Lokiarchaeota archaeon]|nr:MFS transporter [Candidatus Lokiarchaeota archaeon]MBD3340603.1 MFS transporter [Candidatus Lokiarchaeota archaeon]
MSETNESSIRVSKGYFRLLVVILIFIEILDAYTTGLPAAITSNILTEFFSDVATNTAQAVFAFGSGIAMIGMYFVVVSQYFADRFGRKPMLILTCLGMGFASLMIALSTTFVMYVVFLFLLYMFFSSDIWMIYINEECPSEKRVVWANIVVAGGIFGLLLTSILRGVFIRGTPGEIGWRGLPMVSAILGFALAVICIFAVKESSVYVEHKEKGEEVRPGFKENVSEIFKSTTRQQMSILLVITFIGGLSYLFQTLITGYLADQGGLSEGEITLVLLVVFAMILAGYLFSALTGDKLGRKFLIYFWSSVMPIFVIITVILVTIGLAHSIITWIFVGLGVSAIWGLLGGVRITSVEIVPTEKRGTAAGLRSLLTATGTTAGLLLSSIVIFFFGLGVAFIVFTVPLYINIPLTAKYIKETKGVDLAAIKVEPT